MLSKPQTTLLAFLAISSFAQASWLGETVDGLVERQRNDDAAGSRPTSDSVVPPVTSSSSTPTVITETSSSTIIPTTSDPTTTTSSTLSTTSSPPPSTSSSVTSSTPSSTSETPSTSSTIVEPTPSTSSSIPTTSSSPLSSSHSQTVIRVTKTETVDGQIRTSISESTSTSPATATDPASLNQSKETSGSNMSPKTRSTIIGVVVGIGGAVLLGGLAVVAYRIWGRKKSREDADDFYDQKRPNTMEKAGGSSGSGSSNPFKSTLENYHNPAKVNASSNF